MVCVPLDLDRKQNSTPNTSRDFNEGPMYGVGLELRDPTRGAKTSRDSEKQEAISTI